MSNNANTLVTGLENSSNFKEDEMNLVTSLMEAADYKNSEDSEAKINIKNRKGKLLFSFRVRPLSQTEIQAASKKATKQIPNPAGPKYPAISGERNQSAYHNYLIYTATVDADKKKIWGNAQVKEKYGIIDDADTVDVLLDAGTKSKAVDTVLDISGFNNDNITDEEEYIKNS